MLLSNAQRHWSNDMTHITSTHQLVNILKDNQEDFEFYPTTEAIIDAIKSDLENKAYFHNSNIILLEIGAGDCRVTSALRDSNTYHVYDALVVEKAITHIKNLPDNVTLVGTEFFETTLASIETDVIFCNPPFGQYDVWADNIIRNCFASIVYLVIPERWTNNYLINAALKQRGMMAKVIYSGDFLDADRKARAKIDVLRIVLNENVISDEARKYKGDIVEFNIGVKSDPLDKMLKNFDKQSDFSKYEEQVVLSKQLNELIVQGGTIIDMVEFYNKDLDQLKADFEAICKISPKVLKIMGISRETLMKSIKNEMANLKNVFWREFLDCYEPITSRLTKKSRESLYKNVLSSCYNIDFTVSNCYAMTVIAIERANSYTDEQIKELFFKHANKDNLSTYKSNQKVLSKNQWRYHADSYHRKSDAENIMEAYSHCKLEYRLVCNYWYSTDWQGRTDVAELKDIINDYIVIARTLGMSLNFLTCDDYIDVGHKITYRYTKQDKIVELFDIRFYKKGTYHIRLSQEFALRLNVAIAKLFGWVTSAEQAAEELQENLSDVAEAFANTTHIAINYANFMGIGYCEEQLNDDIQDTANVDDTYLEDAKAEKEKKAEKGCSKDYQQTVFDFDEQLIAS